MRLSSLLIGGLGLYLCTLAPSAASTPIRVANTPLSSTRALLPFPQQVQWGKGYYQLPKSTHISLPNEHSGLATQDILIKGIRQICGIEATTTTQGYAQIELHLDSNLSQPEGYKLSVRRKGVSISAATPLGLLYGTQTLLQLTGSDGRLPFVEINDAPRFGYRGIMLDVSRHFMSLELIKSILHEMSIYKLNRFHWHLVDGGGWRMESKAYPLLTERAAYRDREDWDEWWQSKDGRHFTTASSPNAYGGYYTQDQIREIVAYAERLGITIIPEIEMPGHSNEIFAAYPELGCKGQWDYQATDVCIGNEDVFTFYEKILDEVMNLFPSRYIHIGGDEASMNYWGSCAKCQKRMQDEGLHDLHELQSYAIKRIERYLAKHGRKLIGWDEILMGGLAPDATVMSWRGEEGGEKALQAGHDVIMTPGSHVYLDFYQAPAETEPRAQGGYTPIEKVYSYNPLPQVTDSVGKSHILGIQGNLWTEYVSTDKHAEYMLYPRLLAIAEIGWTPTEHKDFKDFSRRATVQTAALTCRGRNAYQLGAVNASMAVDTLHKQLLISLQSEHNPCTIHYTLDGSQPTLHSPIYNKPIAIQGKAELVAIPFDNKGSLPHAIPYRKTLSYHQGIGARVTYNCQINPKYPAGGERALVDGYRGAPTYLDGRWQGFTETMDITIDLGSVRPLHNISMEFMQERIQWVYMPASVEVWVSCDGEHYHSLGTQPTQTSPEEVKPVFESFSFPTNEQARYIRVVARNERKGGYFIFTDEITID